MTREKSNIFVANFLTEVSRAKLKNLEQNNTSAVVAAVTLNKTTRQQLLLPPP